MKDKSFKREILSFLAMGRVETRLRRIGQNFRPAWKGWSYTSIFWSKYPAHSKKVHFGNAIMMSEMLPHIPPDTVVMGNIDPAGRFRNGTPESVHEATLGLLNECGKYPNFAISSGCDIPPMTKWENTDAFSRRFMNFIIRQNNILFSPSEKSLRFPSGKGLRKYCRLNRNERYNNLSGFLAF